MGFLDWLKDTWQNIVSGDNTYDILTRAGSVEEMEAIWNALPAARKLDPLLLLHYNSVKAGKSTKEVVVGVGIDDIIEKALDAWLVKLEAFEPTSPADAKAKIAAISADVIKLGAAMTVADLAISKLPWVDGAVIAGASRRTMAWLGFGAVLTAVAHDPVKIGMLRPYQDALEATFRNRRPDDTALFQAYRTRELAPEKVEDLSKLDDALMNKIEADNDKIYFEQISRWGYSVDFATALSRSATRTLGFSQLVMLARAGIYDRGLFIYSLWGEGLDRVVMKPALSALETLRDREMYSGFRSMIEPSYVEGLITEADLTSYWTLSGIPEKVQDWVLPRLTLRRGAYEQKQKTEKPAPERDLTVSQIQSAYVADLIKGSTAANWLKDMGYPQAEVGILMSIADLRRKVPVTAKLKRLPLGDYEKAFKAKLITQEKVLERMQGEYTAADITLEKQLLEAEKA